MEKLDFSARYTHPNFKGSALYISGYPKVWVPYTFLDVDDEGNEVECESDEGEWELDETSGSILVVMVGDDHKWTVDAEDLVKIGENDYCDGCGQIGCGHGSNRED